MSAIVLVNYLDDPEIEKVVRSRLQRFMDSYVGHWMIQITGSARNPIWEMTVKCPDGKRHWVNKLYGEDGCHAIDGILNDLRRIVQTVSVI